MAEAQQPQPPPQPAAGRWPPQIKFIVGNEACERFSYYGMRSILAGYITGAVVKGGLGQTDDRATELIHLFVFANYFMPLFGAWLSDRIIGRYHTILWVSLFYCAGHGVLACSGFAGTAHGRMLFLCAGLSLIAFGSGGIKPCVSAFMGDQFKPEQSHLLQKAYGAFYWSINFGSFFSFLVIPWIKDHHGFSLAFAVPGILMAIATFIFWSGTKYYVRVPPSRVSRQAGFFRVYFTALQRCPELAAPALINLGATLFLPALAIILMIAQAFAGKGTLMKCLGWTSLGCVALWYLLVLSLSLLRRMELPDMFWQKAAGKHDEKEISGARSFNPILFVFALIPIFFSLFDQTNSTWVLQGEKMLKFRFQDIGFVQQLLPNWLGVSITFGCMVLIACLFFLVRKRLSLLITMQSLIACASLVVSTLFGWAMYLLPQFDIGAEQMQSMNPLIVMILVPLFTLGIYPYIGRLAAPLNRMTMGMFLAAASYLVVAALQLRIEHGEQLSVLWQTLPYFILTAAEVLISTTGLEFAFREAGPEMKSIIMGFWLLAIAFGDLMITSITKLMSNSTGNAAVTTHRFLQYAELTFVVAILFSIVAAFYKYRDPAAAQGK